MKIYHILKKWGEDTYFRPIMHTALETTQNLKRTFSDKIEVTVYIASGFFSMKTKTLKDVLHYECPERKTKLIDLLSGFKIEVMGAYYSSNDLIEIKNALLPVASSIDVYYKNRFHSKLFAILINGKPIFEIIGSSNMTISAYEGKRSTGKKIDFSFNTESDLIIYEEEIMFDGGNCPFAIQMPQNENMMQFLYDIEANDGTSLSRRMETLIDYFNEMKEKMRKI